MSDQFSSLRWRTSSYSTGEGTQCVQIAELSPYSIVAARDSKDPDGGTLAFSRGAWGALVGQIKAGVLDPR
ncbi:DUF397 domain-containing protein [Spirillospora sp. NPDC029432]|uniref:DUF397 domain-containing protein n=1 Tax=Spirillospora sp. NPDC029432 TaxID=3154599 RepID=UPI0034514985